MRKQPALVGSNQAMFTNHSQKMMQCEPMVMKWVKEAAIM